MAIVSFNCKETKTLTLHERRRVKRLAPIEEAARRKLAMLDAAVELRDLASPLCNRLEALKGDTKNQHSIRINDQFRVCFIWTADGPVSVEIVDCH
jgi:toxin HigB-1